MKTPSLHRVISKSSFLLPAIILLCAFHAQAQEQKKSTGNEKRTVSILITKDVDGKTTQIDTTFEATDDFDVDAFVKEHDAGNVVRHKNNNSDKSIVIRMPEMNMSDMSINPDTLVINGDTIIVNTEINTASEGLPGMEDMGMDNHFEIPAEPFGHECCPGQPECRQGEKGCQPTMIPFTGFGFPGMENLMPFGDLENLKIKTKRHGKKVIMTFRDNERKPKHRHHMEERSYCSTNDSDDDQPSKHKKVIILKDDRQAIEKEMNVDVERRKEGDREVIIIKKKMDSDNK
jgi:hypothetical protein